MTRLLENSWKVLSVLVIPTLVWAVTLHVAVAELKIRVSSLEGQYDDLEVHVNEEIRLITHDVVESKQELARLTEAATAIRDRIEDIRRLLEVR